MNTTPAEKTQPIQNMGIVDRTIRFVLGSGLIGTVVLYYDMEHPMLNIYGQIALVVVALYPLWTCNVGWDPVYALFGLRSGNDTGRNQCGTLPYQVKAAAGKAPKYCDIYDERSLEACHEEPQGRPLHPHWQVDREPIMYPDRETLDEYFRRHPGPSAGEGETARNQGHRSEEAGTREGRSSVRAA